MASTELKYDIFDINRSTYVNDFTYPPKDVERTRPWNYQYDLRVPRKLYPKPRPKPVYRDYATLEVKSKHCVGEFDSFLERKPIVQTNPHDPLLYPEFPTKDEGARKRRPRVVMCPAVSLDEAGEMAGEETRDLLLKFTYISTQEKGNQEASPSKQTKSPQPSTVLEPRADQVRLITKVHPPMPRGWTALAGDWERIQPKYGNDLNIKFWEKQAPKMRCACVDPCDGLVTDDMVREITHLVQKDRLSQAYTIPLSTYAGYMPRLPVGVTLAKLPMDISDPRMSVYEAFNTRLMADNRCKK